MNLKSMTKPQLLTHIEALNAEALKRGFEIAALREKLAMSRPVGYTPPRGPRSLPQHFVAARAMAIAAGITVKVGA